jgi:hypothetical protein
MKRLMYVIAVAMFMVPVLGLMSPVYAQFDGDVDLSGILNGGGERGGNRGGNNRGPQIPDSAVMFNEIKDTLKKGKTPMDKAQEKPIQSLLNMEIVTLTDKIQTLRNNNNNNGNNSNFPQNEQGRGGRGGANNNQPQNAQASEQAIKIDTITSLKNEEFLATKLSGFLSPEQVALIQKTHAEDKSNSTCLGGMLDRYYQQLNSNNNRGNNNQNYNNNNNNNNNQTRPNGQKYCMTLQATDSERLEPIRKVLAKGNLPLSKDKDMFAEIFMKAELKDLETALRAGLTNNNNQGGRGNNNNNRNNNPQQMIQSSIDGMYKKVEEMLKPEQAATLKTWHYTQMLGRTPIDSLIAVNAMQDTPLSDEQITKVTAAWPELRNQIQAQAKAAGVTVDAKKIDGAAMNKILDMLEPSQVASYQLAKKYGAEAVAK